jgi:hypothetical protein
MLKSVQQLSLHKSHSIMITASVDTKSQCLPTFACLHGLHACRLAFRLLPVGSILDNGSWEALASNPELPPGTEMPELIGPELIVFTLELGRPAAAAFWFERLFEPRSESGVLTVERSRWRKARHDEGRQERGGSGPSEEEKGMVHSPLAPSLRQSALPLPHRSRGRSPARDLPPFFLTH